MMGTLKQVNNLSIQHKLSIMLFLLQLALFTLACIFILNINLLLHSALHIRRWKNSCNGHQNLPPSPKKLPLIGNFHQLGSAPHRSLRLLSKQHGPVMLLHLGQVPVFVISSPQAAEQVMKTQDLNFASRPKSTIPSRLLYQYKEMAFAPYGKHWRDLRSISTIHLLSSSRVHSYRHVREEETALMMKRIRDICVTSENPSPTIDLTETFMTLGNDIFCRVAVGRKYSEGEDGVKAKEFLNEFIELLGVFRVGDYIPWLSLIDHINGLDRRVKRAATKIDKFLEGIFSDHINRKENNDRLDFMDILLQIRENNKPIQRDSIKGLIMDMFAAGTHTTTTILEWAMAELLRNPRIMKELQTEIRRIAEGKSVVTEEDTEKMVYLKMVIKETLRLHAPLPLLLPRESKENVSIMGYDIKAGTQVIINAWAIGRDSSVWNDADEFRPERFLNRSVDFKGSNFELIPFGSGRRGCPGIQFGVSVNELVLANLLNGFDFEASEDLDMTESIGIAVRKKSPLVATIAHSCFN